MERPIEKVTESSNTINYSFVRMLVICFHDHLLTKHSIARVIYHPSLDSVFGKTPGLCENNDKFAVDRSLNADPRPGDVAVIHDSGAHGHSMGFNYNGKPRSAEPLDHL